MERIEIEPRKDSAKKLESIGLSYHAWDNFWNESACYKFTSKEVDELEEATECLHEMCLTAVEHIIANNRFAEMGIPEEYWQAIANSYNRDELTLYGRFDLAYDGNSVPKMLEYNADTPTSLLESAVAQWYWMEEVFPDDDQFNSVHERLVDQWKKLPALTRKIHFASLSENEEDWVCVHYLMETAIQAGFQVEHIYVEDIGWDNVNNEFVDLNNERIEVMFKLYPWEWMMREDFGKNVLKCNTKFVEPMWKCLLSNKAILPILWELFPGHPYLLPAYFTPDGLTAYAKKPIFSREGANIELVENGLIVAQDEGPYGAEGYVYQALHTLPDFGDKFAVIGSWIVGDKSAGICLREDTIKITTNMSRFVPHYFVEA